MPLWNLTSNLEKLSLRFQPQGSVVHETLEEQSEEMLMGFELPDEVPTTAEARHALHVAISNRTVVAAAKAGHLRSLNTNINLDAPFAIRTLLPHWVAVQQWQDSLTYTFGTWQSAAWTLRIVLTHASLWYGTDSASGPRDDRLLTGQEIRGLQSHFDTVQALEYNYSGTFKGEVHLLDHYLPWLAEDEELSQQVADAWRAVVQHGEVDDFECDCDRCNALRAAAVRLRQGGFVFGA